MYTRSVFAYSSNLGSPSSLWQSKLEKSILDFIGHRLNIIRFTEKTGSYTEGYLSFLIPTNRPSPGILCPYYAPSFSLQRNIIPAPVFFPHSVSIYPFHAYMYSCYASPSIALNFFLARVSLEPTVFGLFPKISPISFMEYPS